MDNSHNKSDPSDTQHYRKLDEPNARPNCSADKATDFHIIDDSKPASLLERLLNPKAVQWMMVCGGAVLVLGFVGWLWTMGVFENPITVALAIGGATLGTMATGIGLFRMSEHKQAGSGLTLLACLAMPLNLWFYNAQGLITLADGGHLWIPAAICCGIYAIIAKTLRQPTFAYTLVGGVVMTGLLFLADQGIGRFFELLSPVTFLVTTGWLCVFSTRLFPQDESDFSRENFGQAFQYSGMLVLLGGLVVLAGGQLAGQLNGLLFSLAELPAVTNQMSHKLWALAVIGISTAGCFVQYATEKRKRLRRVWMAAAGILSVWAMVIFVDVLAVQITLAHLSVIAAGGMFASNIMASRRLEKTERPVFGEFTSQVDGDAAFRLLGTLFIAGMALFQFVGQFAFPYEYPMLVSTGWVVVLQIATAAAACWTLPLQSQRYSGNGVREANFHESMASILLTMAAFSAVLLFAPAQFIVVAAATMALPVAMRFALNPRITTNGSFPLTSPATASALTAAACLFCLTILGPMSPSMLQWSAVMAMTSVCCLRWRFRNVVDELSGFLAGTCSLVLLLSELGCSVEIALPLSLTALGVAMALFNKFRLAKQTNSTDDVVTAVQPLPAVLMVLCGSICGILAGLAFTFANNVDLNIAFMLMGQLTGIGLASWLTSEKNFRSLYRGLAIGTVATLAIVLNTLLEINNLHRLEIGTLLVGLTLLVLGHIGWAREGQKQDESVSTSLWMGSLATVLPIGLGLLVYRTFDFATPSYWNAFHEVSAIIVALSLIAAGISCQIRSTTLAGAGLLSLYIMSLVTLIRLPDQLQSASVIMMVGGGLFFATAVLLSIYRDRLQRLPEQIREKSGIFRVMKWR